MPQQSSDVHTWRAGYRAYVAGESFTAAPPPGHDRDVWLAGYARSRTDRARANDTAEGENDQ